MQYYSIFKAMSKYIGLKIAEDISKKEVEKLP